MPFLALVEPICRIVSDQCAASASGCRPASLHLWILISMERGRGGIGPQTLQIPFPFTAYVHRRTSGHSTSWSDTIECFLSQVSRFSAYSPSNLLDEICCNPMRKNYFGIIWK